MDERKPGEEAQPSAECAQWEKNPITPELREWALRQINEAEIIAALRELREQGGLELRDFLQELEQIVTPQ